MKSIFKYFLMVSMIALFYGCLENPLHVSAKTISKQDLTVLKDTLIQEGYSRISMDDFKHEGAYCTMFSKHIWGNGNLHEIIVTTSHKKVEDSEDMLRNLGVWIYRKEKNPETEGETFRIQDIAHNKLLNLPSVTKVTIVYDTIGYNRRKR